MSERSPTIDAAQATDADAVMIDLQEILSQEGYAEEEPRTVEPSKIDGVVVGTLVGWDPAGRPLVNFPGNLRREPLPAKSIASVQQQDAGREAALMFEEGDQRRPMLMGLIHDAGAIESNAASPQQQPDSALQASQQLEVISDDERIELRANKEIVLRCGKASITLTRAGKVLIRGAYLLSRSSGANRIKGGSVQLN